MPNAGDSAGSSAPRAGRAIEGMLDIARYHREHERFHSMSGLETAIDLRRDANAFKVLAEGWLTANEDEASSAVNYQDARFRAADRAAALMAEQAADLSLSDADWTRYIQKLESRVNRPDRASAAPATDSPRGSDPPDRQQIESEEHASGPRTRTRPTGGR